MNHLSLSFTRRLHALLAVLAVVLLAACATPTTLNAQWVNPLYAGKAPLGKIMVMGITKDSTNRRVFEDSMVKELSARGVPAVPSYIHLPADGPAELALIENAVKAASANAIITSRVVNVSQTVEVIPGMVMGPGFGRPMGWGGFYGFYNGMWASSFSTPPQIRTQENIVADTQLFDVNGHTIVWSGSTTTTPSGQNATQLIQQFAQMIVNAMATAKVI